MNEAVSSARQAWESFYVIVGSSAGALTGLQFVVMTLIIEAGGARDRGAAISAFGSPNVVHFCAALLVSAIFSAPWQGLQPAGVACALCGVAGFAYSVLVLRRTLRQMEYKPVLEDWIWHAALPILAYAALFHSGIVLSRNSSDTLYIVGGAVLLLVFIGIHNAWDTVMYLAINVLPGREAAGGEARTAAPAAPTTPAQGARKETPSS